MSAGARQLVVGSTRLLGFVGDPVAQAHSPRLLNPMLAAARRDVVVVPLHVPTERFEISIAAIMGLLNLDGLIVTIPFKQRLLPFLDHLTPRARAVGAVNAARRNEDSKWVGDVLDGLGVIHSVERLGVSPNGLDAGLIGAGAAGAAIAFALAEAGVASLAIVDKEPDRAETLARRVAAHAAVPVSTGPLDRRAIGLLVHATPMGMKATDALPIDPDGLPPSAVVVDIVTAASTALLEGASLRGCRCVGGADVVSGQSAAMLGFFGLAGPLSSFDTVNPRMPTA